MDALHKLGVPVRAADRVSSHRVPARRRWPGVGGNFGELGPHRRQRPRSLTWWMFIIISPIASRSSLSKRKGYCTCCARSSAFLEGMSTTCKCMAADRREALPQWAGEASLLGLFGGAPERGRGIHAGGARDPALLRGRLGKGQEGVAVVGEDGVLFALLRPTPGPDLVSGEHARKGMLWNELWNAVPTASVWSSTLSVNASLTSARTASTAYCQRSLPETLSYCRESCRRQRKWKYL